MNTTTPNRSPAEELKPRITLTVKDYESLSRLARAAADRMPDVASVLTDELDRAQISAESMSGSAVCMGSAVEFRDDVTGQVRTVTLVYPGDADISQGKISVLTPVGVALIGLATGDSITWETRTGELRQLTVLKIREPETA